MTSYSQRNAICLLVRYLRISDQLTDESLAGSNNEAHTAPDNDAMQPTIYQCRSARNLPPRIKYQYYCDRDVHIRTLTQDQVTQRILIGWVTWLLNQ